MYELKFTDVGEGLHEAEILQWFVNEGDAISNDQVIAEVQTDKAAIEITSPKDGKIIKKNGEIGDTIKVGETLVEIQLSASVNDASMENDQSQAITSPSLNYPNLQQSPNEKRIIAPPSVRKFARDNNIDLKEVKGTEKNGRINKQDVINYMENLNKNRIASNASASTQTEKGLTDKSEVIPIRGLRKQIYQNMTKSAFTIPHTTGMDEINAEELIEVKQELNAIANTKITYLPIIVKIVTEALKKNPIFNASIDEKNETIILKKQYNIGIAMAASQGLVVPVIHHADKKSIEEIAIEIIELSDKSEKGKLSLQEIRNGTFTISSTGAYGGFYATPIINHPEAGILGVHSIKEKPVILPNREIGIGRVMGISLSFDHRIIDGAPAGLFMNDIKSYLEKPKRLLLKTR